jgi:hypothetical protein
MRPVRLEIKHLYSQFGCHTVSEHQFIIPCSASAVLLFLPGHQKQVPANKLPPPHSLTLSTLLQDEAPNLMGNGIFGISAALLRSVSAKHNELSGLLSSEL